MTVLAVIEMVMTVLVSIDTVLIQPYGPRMCEQLVQAKDIKIYYKLNCNSQQQTHTQRIDEQKLNADHAEKITSTFYSFNLTCLLLDPEMNVNCDGQTTFKKADQPFSMDTYRCFNKFDLSRDNVQMRRVMCTEFPANLMCEVICQHVHVHTVCAFTSCNRSCVFTTKQITCKNAKKQSRNNLCYCTKVSDSTRKQRQMKCVMVSGLTTTRHVKTWDYIQVDKHTISNYMFKMDVSGMRPGSIRREIENCTSNQLTKKNYLTDTNSINCFDSNLLLIRTCVDSSEFFDFFSEPWITGSAQIRSKW